MISYSYFFSGAAHPAPALCPRLKAVALQAGGQGAECPPETSDREIFADVSGKKGKGVKIEKKRSEIVKGKVEKLEIEVGKV